MGNREPLAAVGLCHAQRLALGGGVPISNQEEEVLTAAQHGHEAEPPATPPLWNLLLAWGIASQIPPDPSTPLPGSGSLLSVFHPQYGHGMPPWKLLCCGLCWLAVCCAAVGWHSCGSKGSPRAPSAQSPGADMLPAQGTAVLPLPSSPGPRGCSIAPHQGEGAARSAQWCWGWTPQHPCPAHHCPAQVLRRARVQPRGVGPCTYRRAAGALGRGGQSPSAHTVPSCRSLWASNRDKDFNGNNRKQLLSSDRGSLNYRRRVKNEIT